MAKTKEEKAEYMRKYRAENPEKIKAYRAKGFAKNAEKNKARFNKWRAENPEKNKAKKAKAVLSLARHYVKGILVAQGFQKESITPELIELKRITLKTSRLCRQLKN